ncbi:hypothetical protein F0L17_08070 [Streptomyces sp. TRM43335]|uniref:Uncharacterized protein n=1 Tax=Streptomyces taklimakanensis TaxID=2569853 RepID=A0A6G2B9X8_9ACTN|nr:hypothetical protein [Streptomyces taklimakanensis]MTE19085.1 hypothetical protein [Streptomyces taklimakanensis]
MSAGDRTRHLALVDPGEAAELAALLGRLLRWERNAAVRLRATEDGVLGVFARPARFEVLAVRTARLAEPAPLDATVSAGELLESLDESAGTVTVPAAVTGPPWAGLLPPRGGWRPVGELPYESVRAAAAAVVAEFRRRSEALGETGRTREALDALAEEIWSRPLGGGTGLPLRAVHAAWALGMLRERGPALAAGPQGPPAPPPAGRGAGGGDGSGVGSGTAGSSVVTVLAAVSWLRLRTPYGSIAVRGRGGGGGLSVTPL